MGSLSFLKLLFNCSIVFLLFLKETLCFRALADEEEVQLNIVNSAAYNLPSVEEVEKELKVAPNLQIMKQRIADVMQVLGDFKNRRQEGRLDFF